MEPLDSDYLKEHVGDVLSDALTAVSIQQPADPIEFVGLYLLNSVNNKKRKQKEWSEMEFANKRIQEYEQKKKAREDHFNQLEESRRLREEGKQQAVLEERRQLFGLYLEHEKEKDDEIAKLIADHEAEVQRYIEAEKERQARKEARERRAAEQEEEEGAEEGEEEEEEGAEEDEEEEEGAEEGAEEEGRRRRKKKKRSSYEEGEGDGEGVEGEGEEERRRQEEEEEAEEEPPLEKVEPLDPLTVWMKTYEYRVEDAKKLDQRYLAELQKIKVGSPDLFNLLRGVFFLLGRPTKDVDSFEKAQKLIDFNLGTKISMIHPEEKGMKEKYTRTSLAVKDLDQNQLADAGYGALVLYKWICAALDLRIMSVFQRRDAEAALRASEEEEQEGVEGEPDEEREVEEHGVEVGTMGMRAWQFEEERRREEEERERKRKAAEEEEAEEGDEEEEGAEEAGEEEEDEGDAEEA
ncbi:uncharacterized protein MONOS_4852 [Monocercomonoides exilis]|uniref:uncharacterized protein n=1 Tax=Monocercomonoides exilis TaxID=2049356 RepID=UPI00355A5B88|nr:hypothetical protein MONOS_4852 [Monocercomonoides exilis]